MRMGLELGCYQILFAIEKRGGVNRKGYIKVILWYLSLVVIPLSSFYIYRDRLCCQLSCVFMPVHQQTAHASWKERSLKGASQ